MNARRLLPLVLFVSACTHLPGGSNLAEQTKTLENTQWQLLQLTDGVALDYEEQRRPSLAFDTQDLRVAGSGGCNRFMGGYQLMDQRLQFSQLATTQMACAKGMQTEHAYMQSLMETASWQISDDGQLELYDADNKLLARFQPGS